MAYTLAGLIVLADQISKALIEARLEFGRGQTVIAEFFYLVHARNTGAAWSIMADLTWSRLILSSVSLIASCLIVLAIKKSHHKAGSAILGLVLGGSVGNLIDRVRFGYVTDFLSFKFAAYTFPTFNVADMAITSGVFLLLGYALVDKTFLDRLFPWLDNKQVDTKLNRQASDEETEHD